MTIDELTNAITNAIQDYATNHPEYDDDYWVAYYIDDADEFHVVAYGLRDHPPEIDFSFEEEVRKNATLEDIRSTAESLLDQQIHQQYGYGIASSLIGFADVRKSYERRTPAATKEQARRTKAVERANKLVHEVLNHYPSAIPWFIGIYDDWTIGSITYNPCTKNVELHSENFSDKNFHDMCRFLSEKLNRELSSEFLLNYTGYNGEPRRLVVKQFVQAVAALIMGGYNINS